MKKSNISAGLVNFRIKDPLLVRAVDECLQQFSQICWLFDFSLVYENNVFDVV
ncbi:MAG: hypothetical protein ACK46Y_17600 [Fluviicola sp.]